MSRLFSYRVRSRLHLLAVTAACFLFIGNAQCQERKGQVLKLDDCCDIISIDGENLIVYARHMETGRVLQFGVDVLDIRSVRIGDMVGATFDGDAAVVTSIAGADRNYTTVVPMPDDWEPTHGFAPNPDGWAPIPPGLEWPPSAENIESGAVVVRSGIVQPAYGDFEAPDVDDSNVCCPIVPNPELSGVSGRVVVDVLEGVSDFHVEVFKEGTSERARDWYGNASVDFLPGDYDIKLNGVLVTGAKVNRQMDTTIRCGALSVNLSDGSHWEVFDEAQETRFNDKYGTATIALPIGVYAVRVAGGWLRIEIEDGAVTTI